MERDRLKNFGLMAETLECLALMESGATYKVAIEPKRACELARDLMASAKVSPEDVYGVAVALLNSRKVVEALPGIFIKRQLQQDAGDEFDSEFLKAVGVTVK